MNFRRHKKCYFRKHATSVPAEFGGETHNVSRDRARTQVLLQAQKSHVYFLVPSGGFIREQVRRCQISVEEGVDALLPESLGLQRGLGGDNQAWGGGFESVAVAVAVVVVVVVVVVAVAVAVAVAVVVAVAVAVAAVAVAVAVAAVAVAVVVVIIVVVVVGLFWVVLLRVEFVVLCFVLSWSGLFCCIITDHPVGLAWTWNDYIYIYIHIHIYNISLYIYIYTYTCISVHT